MWRGAWEEACGLRKERVTSAHSHSCLGRECGCERKCEDRSRFQKCQELILCQLFLGQQGLCNTCCLCPLWGLR